MQRASFVLVAKAEIGTLRTFARQRGWERIRLLSSHDSTFNRDFGMENADGSQNPGLSVLMILPAWRMASINKASFSGFG